MIRTEWQADAEIAFSRNPQIDVLSARSSIASAERMLGRLPVGHATRAFWQQKLDEGHKALRDAKAACERRGVEVPA